MKKQNIKQSIISWGLFISLMIPMLLDGLHYAIFHHHDNVESIIGTQVQTPEKSHILCSYPFVTEEFLENNIIVTPIERITESHFSTETHIAEHHPYFPNPLRGPPTKA